MFVEIAILILSMLLIVACSELFTNGIEWLGQYYKLSEGVVGSVFAAIGTALPETMVPLIAIISFGSMEGNEVSVGAITGSPFMLSTLTFGLCGLFVWIFSKRGLRDGSLKYDSRVLKRDLRFFIVAYLIVFLMTFSPADQTLRLAVGILVMLFYPLYLWRTFRAEGDVGETPDVLYFARIAGVKSDSLPIISGQVVASIAGIICGAYYFVNEIQLVAKAIGFSPQVLSIIISPIATEFPEKMNSILWARKGKDTLALGNISGALVFQGTLLGGFGVAFTKWNLGYDARLSAIVALCSAAYLLSLVYFNKLNYRFMVLGILTYAICVSVFI